MPDSSSSPAPRDLNAILGDLEALAGRPDGTTGQLREAVAELGRSLAGLFEAVRTERAEQRVRIAELEEELARTRAELADAAHAVPPNDFGQLRQAAEHLRVSTERLMREAGQPVPGTEQDDESEQTERRAAVALPTEPVLTLLPGAGAAGDKHTGDLPVENDLDFGLDVEIADDIAAPNDDAPAEPPAVTPAGGPSGGDPSPPLAKVTAFSGDRRGGERRASTRRTNTPVAVAPRAARKRRGLRRRRIDARKLRGVEATAALRAMVDAVPQLWTAGCPLDLVIALTDGGTLRVSGGDTQPLQVEDVAPGTRARSTVTATRDQLIPLFGRLELTDAQSAPMIHGSRRDADLLVGWIDRAQKLVAEPL